MDDFEKQLAEQLKGNPGPAQNSPKISDCPPKSSDLKKDGTPKKKPGPKAKPKEPDVIIPAQVVQAGKSNPKKLSPKQRETIRTQLVQYFGAGKVDKFMLGATSVPELSKRLCTMRDRMEHEIEQLQLDQEKYLEAIEKEYIKIGRPNGPFTFRELDYLCSIGCSLAEMAGFFDIHTDTLRKKVQDEYGITFNEYYERRSQGIKIGLRRAQIKTAMDGDTSMQKFLGINLLGQKNKIEFDGQVQVNTFADLVKNLDNKTNGQSNESNEDEQTET